MTIVAPTPSTILHLADWPPRRILPSQRPRVINSGAVINSGEFGRKTALGFDSKFRVSEAPSILHPPSSPPRRPSVPRAFAFAFAFDVRRSMFDVRSSPFRHPPPSILHPRP